MSADLVPGEREPSLIDQLLAEQRTLTAVESFARQHGRNEFPAQARHYRDLIPLTAPAAGEQYAFEVELDKCSGCKACVTACHNLNGLDDNETWREVGLLVPEAKRRRSDAVPVPLEFRSPTPDASRATSTTTALQHVTTACHHCVDPGCLNGCPVLAYEKDPITGIVRHLDDQCIGCQYCVLKCPYDVPKYNARLGIVRKCDMCSSRLAVGEAPACVQACPNEAIRITKVNTNIVTIEFRERGKEFLHGAPAGDYTLPTTRYVTPTFLSAGSETSESRSPLPGVTLMAADATALQPQPAHLPLVVMLVLSQASVGVAVMAALQQPAPLSLLFFSLALAVVGLGSSVFHLGRPLGAWRAFLNLKRSWMSREIVVFGMFPPLVAAAIALAYGAPVQDPAWVLKLLRAGSELGAPIMGLVGVFCSVMIYHDTRRPLWHLRRSLPLFFGTMLALGAAGVALFKPSPTLLTTLILISSAKCLLEVFILRHVTDGELTPLKKTALLITGRFRQVAFGRLVCLVLGGIGLPLLLITNPFPSPLPVVMLAFGLLLAGELLERFLYFTTVVAPKMPGGVPS
jgi:formate dehydrogenase iron-sulfur subunit